MGDRINRNIKQGIRSATGGIAKCLFIHHFIKGRIKKIDHCNDPILDLVNHILHEPTKIHVAFLRCNPTGNEVVSQFKNQMKHEDTRSQSFHEDIFVLLRVLVPSRFKIQSETLRETTIFATITNNDRITKTNR